MGQRITDRHNNCMPSIQSAAARITALLNTSIAAGSSSQISMAEFIWKPPESGFLKVHVDDAIRNNKASAGIIILKVHVDDAIRNNKASAGIIICSYQGCPLRKSAQLATKDDPL